MQLTLLGTGCPLVDRERYGPAQLLRAAGTTVLVDCGSGVSQRLLAAGSSGRNLDAILLTHLHSDHIVDLFQLIISSWHQKRDRPQRLFGPPGSKAYVDGLMKLWQPELEQRIAHELPFSTEALCVEVQEIGPGERISLPPFEIDVIEVNHQPVRHAFGFLFAAGKKRVVLSGDTTYCPALIEAAHQADLLLHEVFIHAENLPVPGIRSEASIRNVASYHTLSAVVGKVATEAKVKTLALTHFVPPRFNRDALLAEVRKDYAGPLVIGEDLMTIDCARQTVSHQGMLMTWGGR